VTVHAECSAPGAAAAAPSGPQGQRRTFWRVCATFSPRVLRKMVKAKPAPKSKPSARGVSGATAPKRGGRGVKKVRFQTAMQKVSKGGLVAEVLQLGGGGKALKARQQLLEEGRALAAAAADALAQAAKIEAARESAAQDAYTKLLAAFNHHCRLKRNGKPFASSSPFATGGKLSIAKVARHYGVEPQNLQRAVKNNGVAKPGRPPNIKATDVHIFASEVTKSQVRGDAMRKGESRKLNHVANKVRGTAFKMEGGQYAKSSGRRLRKKLAAEGVSTSVGIGTTLNRLSVTKEVLEQHCREIQEKLVAVHPVRLQHCRFCSF